MINWIFGLFGATPAEVVFLSIFGFGFVITSVSLLFGGDSDGDGDFHLDHGDGGHDMSGHHADGHSEGPSIFSIRGASLLSIGFGGTGFLVHIYTKKLLVSCIAGIASGWVFAAFCLWIMAILYRQEGNSLLRNDDVLQASGIVTTSIPHNGMGEVMLKVAGRSLSYTAQGCERRDIVSGTQVHVVDKIGSIVVVAPL